MKHSNGDELLARRKTWSWQFGLPYLELFYGRVTGPNKAYFLYETGPCRWRENWRHIRGFSLKVRGHYLTFCAWRQTGVYVPQRDTQLKQSNGGQ